MSLLQLPPLGLYIHIPWCLRKCPYCDFNSHESATALPEADYVSALLLDLEQDLPLVQGRELQSIFIGGGTPSLFSGASIKQILAGVGQRVPLAADAEITLEANPGTAEARKFQQFVEAGVNRLSLGVQSFNDLQLARLGRVHDSAQARGAIAMAQGIGLRSFNIDLMHGLPGQSVEDAHADLQVACSVGSPHVSWYQLTIEPNTVFYKRPPTLPTESVLAGIQAQGETLLQGQNYQQYEVSAYAREGYQCRHNLNYWHFGDYLGIGAGAHSKLTDLSSQQVVRYSRPRQPQNYMNRTGRDFHAETRSLVHADLISEYMMNGLRLNAGIDLRDFSSRTGLAADVLEQPLQRLLERELLAIEESRVRPTALGRRYLDTVVAEFFQ